MMSWVPLHVHSQYSILDASASVDALAKRAAEYELPALALTDHGNLFGAVEFYQACSKQKIKPLIGCEVYVAPQSRHEKRRAPGERTAYHLVLLAKNEQGYRNLCILTSRGYTEGFYYNPRVDRELLEKHHEGLVCLSACLSGQVPALFNQGKVDEARAALEWHHRLFGEDYYLEIQRHPMSGEQIHAHGMEEESWLLQKYQDFIEQQERTNLFLIEEAKARGIPLVATNDIHYLGSEDWQAHEVLLNVQSGEPCEIWEKDSLGNLKRRIANPKRRTYPSHEMYFKSPQQMQELFHDLPEALATTLEVAEKCTLQIDFETKHYPVYIPPAIEGKEYTQEQQKHAAEDYLRLLCEKGITERYTAERLAKVEEVYPGKDPMQVVRERLDFELDIIISKGLCDYLLIVYDFIHWSKIHGIPVGPGRGSGAGSIILYLIGITDIEPLRFHLFFERFINPERMSYPDIDVDICMEGRGSVIEYTLQKYGKENVAQIITFGTMKAKMVIKDVGRVLSVPLSHVNNIAKLIPDDLNITLEKALEVDPDLRKMYEDDEDTRRIIDIGRRLEGCIRNTGIHAAGVLICGEELTQHIPICVAKDTDMAVSQYSMKPVEAVGMLKVDFLGLKTLTCIQKTVEAVEKSYGNKIDWVNLSLEDQNTFKLLNQGKTLGVFQLESSGMQELARQLHLDRFEEIIAVVSLYRPGPMDMIPSYIQRKHGKEPIEYDHPTLEGILSETYGIMVYQEQVMQIASELANFSLGEGDVLRRAMGKKDMQKMAEQRQKFLAGAAENGIDANTATTIFDKMEKFAAYGFNKSHAAAYAFISYITAYMKANYPKEWMAALMTCDRDDLTKVSKFIRECQAMGIPILPPDINEARAEFTATTEGIRFAMAGVKGVGTGVVEAIVKEREASGPFESLYDFFQRVDPKKVGKKAVEQLILAGSFDFTGWSRDALCLSVEPMYDLSVRQHKEKSSGVMTFFGLMGDDEGNQHFAEPPRVEEETPKIQQLIKEKELLGFFLTGHPMESYRPVLKRLSCLSIAEFYEKPKPAIVRAAFIVESVQIRLASRTQKKFAILMISDGFEKVEITVWPDVFEEKSHLIQENQLLYAVLQVEDYEGGIRATARWIAELSAVNESMIEACDQAYDRAKLQMERMQMARDRQAKTKKEEVPVKQENSAPSLLQLTLNADTVHLSHIVKIKEIFREHAGDLPIRIRFESQQGPVGDLEIQEEWGVTINPQLLKALGQIESLAVDSH